MTTVESPTSGKRSFSATIIDFFKRPSSRNQNLSGDNKGDQYSSLKFDSVVGEEYENGKTIQSNNRNDNTGINERKNLNHIRKARLLGSSSQNDNGYASNSKWDNSVFLYEADSTDGSVVSRPPVLPILPIQRLKLLRQKQYWRQRLNNYNGMNPSLRRSSHGLQVNLKTPILSQTPTKENEKSAVVLNKNASSKLLNNSKTWSGEFEYDLNDFKNEPITSKQISTATTSKAIPDLSSTTPLKMKTNISKESDSSLDLNTAQKSLLLNGLKPPKSSVNNISFEVKKSGSVLKNNKPELNVLPTMGFDFIKDTETPSKNTVKASVKPVNMSEPALPLHKHREDPDEIEDEGLRRKKRSHLSADATKPSFSFSKPESTSVIPGFGQEMKAESTAIKPSFSFGKIAQDSDKPQPSLKMGINITPITEKETTPTPSFSFKNPEPATEEDKKLPISFGLSSDDKKEAPKSTLNFGGISNENKEVPVESSFNISTKPNETKGNGEASTTPSFLFNSNQAQDQQEKTTKPVLSFGTNVVAKETESTKATFKFGIAAVEKKEEPAKPSISFGLGASNSKEATTKPLVSFGLNAAKDKEDTQKPSFSFNASQDSKETTPTTSSFMFGKKPEAENTDDVPATIGKSTIEAPQASAPSFNFVGATSKTSESTTSGEGTKPFQFGSGSNIITESKELGISFENKETGSKTTDFAFNKAPSTNAQSIVPGGPTSGFSLGTNKAVTNFNPLSSNIASSTTSTNPLLSNNLTSNPLLSNNNASSGFKFEKKPLAKPSIGNGFGNSLSNPVTNTPSSFNFGGANNIPPVNSAGGPSAFNNTFNQFNGTNANNNNSMMFNGNNGMNTPMGMANPVATTGTTAPMNAFNPSSQINMKFGNTGNVNPVNIFSGHNQAQIPVPTQSPLQVFGGPGAGMNGNDMPSSNNQQAMMGNMQNLPVGRKLARMRQHRR
ncbi:hypothetical protein Kpol_1029p13 [Vanderwaltozyma polyspora DSM 70294]|uniref:Nucleoporin NUP1 n=1 Tax=Vanderwaltozyma polyspora (strain ATCC 22028 / DSM 70294 / BCRC 21397 / CBS 2163 / NBRC 10782 / NRRL Y-8283 / UCD 57-17) TaxID=436907 RepID=A7TR71_VANPO|nr:uncharacterized protein Kpol_1029p13 [Vanderwaltozyma polyspora DSM 70294]EDO15239.1 hypothetical protein Kpol_1029p13 [Vanderwaltozyma polyspora DSM 70294]